MTGRKMHVDLIVYAGLLLSLTGICSAGNVTVSMDKDGGITAAYKGVPLVRGLQIRHNGIGVLKPVVTNTGTRFTAEAKGPGSALARWSTEAKDNELRVDVKLTADRNTKGAYPLMDAFLYLAPEMLTGGAFEIWGEAPHPGGPVAVYAAVGPVQPSASPLLPYASLKGARFFCRDTVVEVFPGVRTDNVYAAYGRVTDPKDTDEIHFLIRVKTTGTALSELLASPGISGDDGANPRGPDLLSGRGDFEKPGTGWDIRPISDGRAHAEQTATEPHAGRLSLKIEKDSRAGYCLFYPPGRFSTRPAEKDERYLVRYWARTRNSGSVFLQALLGQEGTEQENIQTGLPLLFTLPTGPIDITPWTRMDHIVTLKKGESITRIRLCISGTTGDEVYLDDIAIYKIPDDFQLTDPIKPIQAQWVFVSDNLVPLLPEAIRLPNAAGNILKNASFEAGADRLSRWTWQESDAHIVDRTLAYHGRASLRLRSTDDRTITYKIEPGKLYTLSFYAKADRPGMHVYTEVLSGLDAVYDHGDWRSRPGLRRSFQMTEEWKRYSVSFIPVTRLLPTAWVTFRRLGPKEGNVWVDAMSLEQGTATPFATDAKLQVSARVDVPFPGKLDCSALAGYMETHRKALEPGKKLELDMPRLFMFDSSDRIPFLASVFSDRPRKVILRWEFIDYYGRVARLVEHTVDTDAAGYAEDRFELTGLDLGRYVIHCRALAEGCEAPMAEETSFVVLPKILDDPAFQTDFGFTCWVPSWIYWHRRLGFHTIRTIDGMVCMPYLWGTCEEKRGEYKFFDGSYNWLKEKGVDTMVCLTANLGSNYWFSLNLPQWAQVKADAFPKGTAQYSFGFDPDAYVEFVGKLAEHWRGRIKEYEIWNEPYQQRDSAKPVGEVGRKIAQAIRKADPKALIYSPCSTWAQNTWTEQAVGYLKTDLIDGFCHHGYPTRYDEEMGGWTNKLDMFNRVMEKNGGIKPIVDTEMMAGKTYLWTDRPRGTGNLTYLPSWQSQEQDRDTHWPKIVGPYYISARAAGGRFFFTYQAWEPGYGTQDDLTPGNGLLATAINGWLMGGSRYVQQINCGDKARIFVFKNRDGRLMAAGFGRLMDDPIKIRFALPADGTTIYGAVGTKLWPNRDKEPLVGQVENGLEMALTRDPFYIVPPAEMTKAELIQSLQSVK